MEPCWLAAYTGGPNEYTEVFEYMSCSETALLLALLWLHSHMAALTARRLLRPLVEVRGRVLGFPNAQGSFNRKILREVVKAVCSDGL